MALGNYETAFRYFNEAREHVDRQKDPFNFQLLAGLMELTLSIQADLQAIRGAVGR